MNQEILDQKIHLLKTILKALKHFPQNNRICNFYATIWFEMNRLKPPLATADYCSFTNWRVSQTMFVACSVNLNWEDNVHLRY